MSDERTPYNEQLRKDLDNFRNIMQVELDYITAKYRPRDVYIEVDKGNGNGRYAVVNLQLVME